MSKVDALVLSLAIGGPEVVLAAGSLILLLIGLVRGDVSFRGLSWGAVILFGFTALTIIDDGPERMLAWNDLYVADALSAYLKIVILVASGATVLMSIPALERHGIARFEYPVLMMLATLGMFVMVSANNLLALYVGLELLSLSSYVLAAFHRDNPRSSEAGLKYFVLGSLASGLLLYGVSLVYGFVGSTDFTVIATEFAAGEDFNLGALFGLVFILVGLAFKVSAVPFHMWTPDVYEGAPTPVTTFFAAASKAAAIGLLLRVSLDAFSGMVSEWRQIIIFLSLASLFLGAVGAIGQENIKRLLAYSSINNVGFMLIALAAATEQGAAAVLFYLAVYVVVTIGAFLVVLAMQDSEGQPLENISDLAGLVRTRPWLTTAMAIFMFSLAGLPPLFGFMPKLAVFNAAVAANLWLLAILGVLASVIGAYYYLRVVKVMLFDAPVDKIAPDQSDRTSVIVNGAMITAAAIFCSPLGYFLLGAFATATQRAATSLF